MQDDFLFMQAQDTPWHGLSQGIQVMVEIAASQ